MNSIDKIIDYVAKVSKEPITIGDKVILDKPVSMVTLSEKFFIKDHCTMCGRCCPNENTAYPISHWQMLVDTVTEKEFNKWGLNHHDKARLINDANKETRIVNGQEVEFISFPKDGPKYCNKVAYKDRGIIERCHWLFERDGLYKCRIHPMRSITCGMPHLRFFHNSKLNRTSLAVSQFGRNWRLGCPIEFDAELDEESVQVRIHWLKMLNYAAIDMRVETYLPDILDYLESGKREPIRFANNDKRRKLF